MIEFFAFLFGICIGSFLTVCIYRLPNGQSVVSPPSHCESCGYRLRAADLIPVLSGLILRGRCRNCGARFSMRHVWIELSTGLVFAGIAWRQGLSAWSVLAMLGSAYMIVVAWIDFDHRRILNRQIVFGFVFFGLYLLAAPAIDRALGLGASDVRWLERLAYGALLGGGGMVLSLATARLGVLGMGDVKLLAVIGLLCGRQALIVTGLGFVIAAITAAALLTARRVGAKSKIPLGPFFCVSYIASALLPEFFV